MENKTILNLSEDKARNVLSKLERRYERLMVLNTARRVGKQVEVLCRCDCGNEKYIKIQNLRNGNTRSCGCLRQANHMGERFDNWKIIGPPKEKGSTKWLCRCDCGTERYVLYSNLKSGMTKGCGLHPGDGTRKFVDYSGQTRGEWRILNSWRRAKNGSREWCCQCSICGRERYILATLINKDRTPKCECRKEAVGRRSQRRTE